MKKIKNIIFIFTLLLICLNSKVLNAAEPIEINNFDDMKKYIEETTYPSDTYPNSFPLKRLKLQSNEYILKNDIVIDENDQWFEEYRDKLEGGIFIVKDGSFVLDGNGHSITMKGVDGKSHSLFYNITCDGENFYRIKNLTINYEGDVEGNGLAYELTGEFQANLDPKTGFLKSGINDLTINVNGSILPIYAKNDNNQSINNNVAYEATSWNIANGLATEVKWSDFENITINVDKNIGSEELGEKFYDIGMSNGFVAIHHAEYKDEYREGLNDITKENLSTFNWEPVLKKLGQAGRSENITLNIGGSIIASAYNDVAVNGYSQVNDSVNENIKINIKGDLKAIQNSGSKVKNPSGRIWETDNDGISVLALDTVNFCKDVQATVEGKILWQNNDADKLDYDKATSKRITNISTGVVNDTSRDNYNVYQNVDVIVEGGIDVQAPETPRGLVFDGGHANEWSSDEFYDHTIIANNSVKTGDIILTCDKTIKFNGIFNRLKPARQGKNLVLDDHQADFGNITLKSEKNVYGGLVGSNKKVESEYMENIRVSAKDINIESGGYTTFSGGVTNNNKGLNNIQTQMGQVNIKGNLVAFGGLSSYNYGNIMNSSADIKGISIDGIDGSENSVYVGGAIANTFKNKKNPQSILIENVSAFIDDSINVENASKTYIGGFVGFLRDAEIKASSSQVGKDIEAKNIKETLWIGGFSGGIIGGNIENNTSLVFGDLIYTGGAVGGFVGKATEDNNVSKNASFVGGKLSSLENSGLFGGWVYSGEIEGNTLLSSKTDAEYQPEKVFVGYAKSPNFSNNKYVFVKEKDRIAYPLNLEKVDNNRGIFKRGNELGKIVIAKRPFQFDYWEKAAELEKNAFPYKNVSYIADNGGKTFTFFTPDSQELISSGDGSVINNIPDYFTRHLSIRDKTDDVVYDIWGIRGGDTLIDVTFDENFSEGNVYDKEAKQNTSLGKNFPVDPQRAGYIFLGWNTSKDGTEARFDKDTIVKAPLTVYAQWEKQPDKHQKQPDKEPREFIFGVQGPKEHPRLKIKDHYQYMYGYPDRNFRPEGQMTRAEVVAMFARIIDDKPDVNKIYHSNYSDVLENDWFYNPIGYLNDKKIITGYPDGSFKPNAPITRAEFAKIASNFDQLSGNYTKIFPDVKDDHWAKLFINLAYEKGWVKGYPDGSFKPDNKITRAEVVTVTNQMLNRKADEDFVDNNKSLLFNFLDLDKTHWAYYHIMEACHGHDYHRLENGIDEKWERLNGHEFSFGVVKYNK